ncbi:ABC transporter substrate-binding protein [Ornithinibacillus bavariensis]|nr:ABC transporter substrate-binding protein [Ornithinibacillus bavariensis]
MKRITIKLLAVLLIGVMLVGCSDKNASGKNKDVTVHLYTSESQDQVGEMMKEFEKENPGIKVEIFRTGTEQVIAKMEAERQSGGLVADMVWFADIDYFNSLSEEDLLEEYKSPNAEGLDESFIYNNGKYYEVRQIFNVLAYNTTQVKNAPTSWNDLYSTDYKGKAAMASPNYSGAAFLTLASIVHNDDLGWDYFKSLKENDLKFEQGNGALASKVASGEYHVVSVVDFMARNAKNEGSPVEVVWPEEGAVIIPTPVGIMKDSEVKDAAKKVLDFLLSKQGQEMFKDQGYIPVNPEVGVPENAPDTDEINIMPLDFDFLKENRESLKTGFSDIFGEQ